MSKKAKQDQEAGRAAPVKLEGAWQTGIIMRHRAHSTGLVNYDYWVYAFEDVEDDGSVDYRRGRIWS